MSELPRNERMGDLTIRIPAALRARVEAYAASLTPPATTGAAIRVLVEGRLDDLDRRKRGGK